MSVSKEQNFLKAKASLERAQKQYDKAYAAWQEELDGIVLRPMHLRSMSRKEAMVLARVLSDDEVFKRVMEMGLLPDTLQKGTNQ
jgi:hypothetical protein